MKILHDGGGIYNQKILPTIASSCATGGCHAQPEAIDLRTFPFAAEGSFALDAIKSDLGTDATPENIQKKLVASIISSMKTGYMPPSWSSTPPVDDPGIQAFETWLSEDLKTEFIPFSGKLTVTSNSSSGSSEQGEPTCSQEWLITHDLFEAIFDATLCPTESELIYSITDSTGTVVSSSSTPTPGLLLTGLWPIDLRLSPSKAVTRDFIRN